MNKLLGCFLYTCTILMVFHSANGFSGADMTLAEDPAAEKKEAVSENMKKSVSETEKSDTESETDPAEAEADSAEAEADSVDAEADSVEPRIIIQPKQNDLISLNFLDVDIREALSALAMERQINIAAAQNVSGKISVHLYNVPLDKALDAIMLAGGFSYHKNSDLYYVYKPKGTKDPMNERLEMRIYKLRYASLDKVQAVLTGFPNMRTLNIHEPSRTIIVEDIPENIEKIDTIISYWDRAPKQVMIEAKILEISLTDDMSFGINWNDILGDIQAGTGGFTSAVVPTTGPVSPVPGIGKGIFTNLIASAGTSHQFTAALDALQSKTKVNTLSTPKILAIHGRPARVQVGGQQGYKVTTSTQGIATESVEFIDTGTILDITPFIEDDGTILLQVRPSINSAKVEEGIPVVNSTEVSTWLIAKSGETVFIGGLIQDNKTKTRDMVPCLGGVVGLGTLFGKTSQNIRKTELIVLITPIIVDSLESPANQKPIEKVKVIEELLKKEPLPARDQLLDFLKPIK